MYNTYDIKNGHASFSVIGKVQSVLPNKLIINKGSQSEHIKKSNKV